MACALAQATAVRSLATGAGGRARAVANASWSRGLSARTTAAAAGHVFRAFAWSRLERVLDERAGRTASVDHPAASQVICTVILCSFRGSFPGNFRGASAELRLAKLARIRRPCDTQSDT